MPEGYTIVAAGTPTGESAIAMVRLTGPDCAQLCAEAFNHPSPTPRMATYGTYRAKNGDILDKCVFTYFKEPASFTGEDMLEISTHGSPFIVQKIIQDLIARGCQPAEPGDFSRTGFLNGKMDLTQAEAIIDLIHARSGRALEAAHKQLDGSVGNAINELVEALLHLIAHLEAYIDFPDEDLPPENMDGPAKELSQLIRKIENLISTSEYTTLLHEGICTVIAGEPNAGKSSLLNALTGSERAIVSDQPGTTRDYIEDRLTIGPYLLRVVDTAGLHEAQSDIEGFGIEKAIEQVNKSDLLLLVVDASKPYPTLPDSVKERLQQGKALLVINKTDLIDEKTSYNSENPNIPSIQISALKKEGINRLRKKILEILESDIKVPNEQSVLVSARHAGALTIAKEALMEAQQKLTDNIFIELVANDLRAALEAMEQITGRIDNERMLDHLFSSFCIGK
jgi:tRNA modification GTPase